MFDRTIISGYLDAAIQPWLMPPFIYSPLSLMTALIADWKTSETPRLMHNDNNCEISGCRKPLDFLQSQHEKDHKVQRHFESFSRLQVKELCVNPNLKRSLLLN